MKHTLHVSSICRPAVGQRSCGDAFKIFPFDDSWVVLVADGLGHGASAAEASERCVSHTTKILEENPNASLETLMQSNHKALAGTRGAAVAISRLLPDEGVLRFCGVGNVALNIFPERRGLGISMPGVVGYRMRKVKVFETEVATNDLITFYSDGISSRFSLKSVAALPLEELVERVEAEHGKDHDDATLVAIRVTLEAA